MSPTVTPVAPAARWALICHSDSGRIEATYWDNRAQAIAARDTLAPCGPRCIGVHTIVNTDPARGRGRHPVFSSGRP
jgi:hypothetical protein